MHAVLIALPLLLAPPKTGDGAKGDGEGEAEEAPTVQKTRTIWYRSGARNWSACSDRAADAHSAVDSFADTRSNLSQYPDHQFALSIRDCPNAPYILMQGALKEILWRADLPKQLSSESDWSEVREQRAESRGRALKWLTQSTREQRRRSLDPLPQSRYWRGRAMLSQGDLQGAIAALEEALATHDVHGWRARAALALAHLYDGDLERAMEYGKRAVLDSPRTELGFTQLVYGLILDRAGDPHGARLLFDRGVKQDNAGNARARLETMVPLHERVYILAFHYMVAEQKSEAIRYFEAYLAMEGPEAPERRLAERHRDQLQPMPARIGG